MARREQVKKRLDQEAEREEIEGQVQALAFTLMKKEPLQGLRTWSDLHVNL